MVIGFFFENEEWNNYEIRGYEDTRIRGYAAASFFIIVFLLPIFGFVTRFVMNRLID